MPDVAERPPIYRPRLGAEGEPCPSCGALMASDQRYCLSCGTRRGATRVAFPQQQAAAAVTAVAAPARPLPAGGWYERYSPQLVGIVSGIAAAAVLGLGMIAGTLIAKQGDDAAPVAAVPVVATATATTTPPPAATATPTAAVTDTFTADWPSGQTGWTIQLQTLPKDGTTPGAVAQAKSDASGKGVAGVGALDSDSFSSLDPGNYVIYSGNYADKQSAEAALGDVTGSFPDAKVVQVGAKSADDTADSSAQTPKATPTKAPSSPEEAQKNTKNAPPTVKSEGTPAPKDDKKPGGDSDATTIG